MERYLVECARNDCVRVVPVLVSKGKNCDSRVYDGDWNVDTDEASDLGNLKVHTLYEDDCGALAWELAL